MPGLMHRHHMRAEFPSTVTGPIIQPTPQVYEARDMASVFNAGPVNAVYYPNWAIYNQQPPSSLNLNHITHILYAFFWINADGTLHSTDKWADYHMNVNGVNGVLADLKRLKSSYPHIKTILSIGGGGEGSSNFSTVALHSKSRNLFATTAKQFLDSHAFDGIDIDWEHPENPSQGGHYIDLLSTLRNTLPSSNYLITSALPAGTWALQNINLQSASQYLDYVNLMAYDFAGSWTTKAGNQAQLYSPQQPYNSDAAISCDSAVTYMVGQGVPASKIILGIPAYGRSFIGAQKSGDSYTSCGGTDGTFDYSALPRPGSTVHFSPRLGATWSVGGDGGFVSYDDPRVVNLKGAYAKQKGLAGLFYWTGTQDTNDANSLVTAGYSALRS